MTTPRIGKRVFLLAWLTAFAVGCSLPDASGPRTKNLTIGPPTLLVDDGCPASAPPGACTLMDEDESMTSTMISILA